MKAGLVVGAAIATAVAVMVSCSPDRIPGSPISSAEPGVAFNAAIGNGNALSSSSGSLSGSTSGSLSGSGPQGGCKSVSGSGTSSGSAAQPPANCGGGNESNSDSGLHCGNNGSVAISGSTSSAIGSSSDSRYCKDKGQGNDDR